MNKAVYRISLDVNDTSSQTFLTARRWETERSIHATLTENGRPYEITHGCSAEIAIRKPDGSVLKNPCAIDGNVIQYELTKRTTSVIGISECEIRLSDAGGTLLTTPRFSLEVHGTIYDYGDATETELANANTVKSANPGYAEVFMWSDGNPDGEDRVGYFVALDTERSPAMVKKCGAGASVMGVTLPAPGFASNAPDSRYDDNSGLRRQYCYVGLLGLAPVMDNGTCVVNGRCSPGEDGTAVFSTSGYLVVERLDEKRVLIMLENKVEVPRIIVGTARPSGINYLWFDTNGHEASVVAATLDTSGPGGSVFVRADGQDYQTANTELGPWPSTQNKYSFDII